MVLKGEITGERVYLRALHREDVSDEYARWLNDPEVNKYLATKSADKPSLIEYVNKKNEQSDALFLGIFLRQSSKHIGTIKLEPIDSVNYKAIIAIMVGDKQSWGKGYGGEAMKILMAYAQKELNIRLIELGVVGENTTAIAAYNKLGFVEVNREYKAVQYGEYLYDQVTMTLSLE